MCRMATISMFWNFDYCAGTPEIDKKTVRFDQARPAVHSRDGYRRLGPSAGGPFDQGSRFISKSGTDLSWRISLGPFDAEFQGLQFRVFKLIFYRRFGLVRKIEG